MKGADSNNDYDVTGFGEDLDLRQILSYALKRAWLVALCVFVFLLAGISYLWITPPIYKAVAMVEVPLEARQLVDIDDTESQDFRSEEILYTIEKNLQRFSLFRRVMTRNEVKGSSLLQTWLEDPINSYEDNELAGMLKEWTTVKLQRDTRLITVSVEHQSPEVAEMLANAIVEEFILERVEMQSGSSASAFEYLLQEAEKARDKLEISEGQLLHFQAFEDALDLKTKIDSQKDAILELSQRYLDKHPKLMQARSSLAELNEQLYSQLMLARPLVTTRTESPELDPADHSGSERAERLEEEIQLLEGRFNVLSREVEADRVLYESIVSRLKQTDVTKQWEMIPLQVVEPAFAPSKPSKPNKLKALAISVFLGGGAGLGLVFLLYAMDSSLRTVEDAARIIGLPVIGAIPQSPRLQNPGRLKRKQNRALAELKASLQKRRETRSPDSQSVRPSSRKVEPLVIISDPIGSAAEALRTVRAELGAKGAAEEPKSFLITSASSGEGKSFVATNVAVSFAAEEGCKTLLIDANLREPIVETLLDVTSSRGGLVEILSDKEDWGSRVVDSGIPNLDVLLAGNMTSNPAEFLSGTGFSDLLKNAGQRYRRIVVDSTRVNGVADALLLAQQVRFAVLVIRATQTPRKDILRARDLLTDMGCQPVGLVLNCLPA